VPETGSLRVTKKVRNATAAVADRSFRFVVTLNDDRINGTYGDMTFEDGVAKFYLKDGESKTATGLPAGVEYIVEEDEYASYVTSSTTPEGEIVADETKVVVYYNTYITPTPTPTPTPTTFWFWEKARALPV
jgi:hypothetical protein